MSSAHGDPGWRKAPEKKEGERRCPAKINRQ